MQAVDRLIGLLAPQVCLGCGSEGSVLCSECIELYLEPVQSRCAGCHVLTENFRVCSKCRTWLPLNNIFIAGNYEGVSEQLVKSLKFEHKRQASEPMAYIMSTVMGNLSPSTTLCPVPTAPKRVRERGFDHALLLSNSIALILDLNSNSFLRRKSNSRQLGSGRKARIAQIKGEFETVDETKIKDMSIILVDDVMTTGATLSATARTLKEAGAKSVSAIIFSQKI